MGEGTGKLEIPDFQWRQFISHSDLVLQIEEAQEFIIYVWAWAI